MFHFLEWILKEHHETPYTQIHMQQIGHERQILSKKHRKLEMAMYTAGYVMGVGVGRWLYCLHEKL